ncbi:hypothetical protein ACFW4T_28430, partial [Streptomyces mutabilis]
MTTAQTVPPPPMRLRELVFGAACAAALRATARLGGGAPRGGAPRGGGGGAPRGGGRPAAAGARRGRRGGHARGSPAP